MVKATKRTVPDGPEEKIRVTLDLPRTFNERLEELSAKTYLGNKAAVIRHALQVYEYLVKTTEEGGSIVIRSPEGQERHLDRLSLAVAR
jgi:hypothetical protein